MSQQTQGISVPSTTSGTIVFPLNQNSIIFETEFYQPEMTDDKVSLQEINRFISDMNDEYKLYKKRLDYQKEVKSPIFRFSNLGIICLILWLIFSDSKDDILGLFTNLEAIVLCLFLSLFFIDKHESALLFELIEKCQALLEKQNGILRGQGLKWHLPDQFPTWIELTKDMQKTNNLWEMAAQDVIPQTTEKKIIIPLRRLRCMERHSQIWRFSQESFSPDMAGGQISCQEVQEFFSEVNNCLSVSVPHRKIPIYLTNLVFFPLVLGCFGYLYIFDHSPELPSNTFSNLYVISCIATIYFSCWLVKKESTKRINHFRAECNKIIDRHNETIQSRGVKWHLPDQLPQWIELYNDSADQNPSTQPANRENDLKSGKENTHKIYNKFSYAPLHDEE